MLAGYLLQVDRDMVVGSMAVQEPAQFPRRYRLTHCAAERLCLVHQGSFDSLQRATQGFLQQDHQSPPRPRHWGRLGRPVGKPSLLDPSLQIGLPLGWQLLCVVQPRLHQLRFRR